MSPQTGSRRQTNMHLNRFVRTLVFNTFPIVGLFIFLIFFLWVHKKHKNVNKRISYFVLLRWFLSTFFIFVCLFAFCAFARLCFCAFLCFFVVSDAFLCFFVRVKSFCKKIIKSLKLP